MAPADALGRFNWENVLRKAIFRDALAKQGSQGQKPCLVNLETKYGQP
jgi:hypothetical protein